MSIWSDVPEVRVVAAACPACRSRDLITVRSTTTDTEIVRRSICRACSARFLVVVTLPSSGNSDRSGGGSTIIHAMEATDMSFFDRFRRQRDDEDDRRGESSERLEYEYASQHELDSGTMEAVIFGEPGADGWVYFREDMDGVNWFRRLVSEPNTGIIRTTRRDDR